MARGTRLATISEKARSEFIVAPVLLAARESTAGRLAIFSGQRLDVDPARGLVGECDFILAVGPAVPPLRGPIATVVEAKENDVEAGLGQCVAQMAGAPGGDDDQVSRHVVTIDEEAFPAWAEQHGKTGKVADLVDDEDLRAEVQAAVDEANKAVSKAESIRKFVILPTDWTEEAGQVTPSLKLKRNVVMRETSSAIANTPKPSARRMASGNAYV